MNLSRDTVFHRAQPDVTDAHRPKQTTNGKLNYVTKQTRSTKRVIYTYLPRSSTKPVKNTTTPNATMARLSAENFRKDNNRKSSNPFTRLISSSSPRGRRQSTPENAGQDTPPSLKSPKFAHGRLKKGWKKVGIWPEDRISRGADMETEGTSRNIPEKQEKHLKGVTAPRSSDASLPAAATTGHSNTAALEEEIIPDLPGDKEIANSGESEVTAIFRGNELEEREDVE
jgi:hypothetical protein